MKEKYSAPAVEIIVVETVNTFSTTSGDAEGSAVLLRWLVD